MLHLMSNTPRTPYIDLHCIVANLRTFLAYNLHCRFYKPKYTVTNMHIAPLSRSVDLYDNICVFNKLILFIAYKSTFIVVNKSTIYVANKSW